MGQARNKKLKAQKYEGMGFPERLQSDASDVVKSAEFLVENGTAAWMNVVMPDGKEWIALLFRPSIWEMRDNRLTLKQKEPQEGE